MKNILPLLLVIISAMLFSCGKKNDDKVSPEGDATWKLGTYAYVKGTSAQTSSADGKITSIAVSTVGTGGNYGAFSGSALTIVFHGFLGEGQYSLGSEEMLAADASNRTIVINCTVGTAVSTGAVMYTYGGTAATATVTKDKDGKFHVSLPTTTLTKKLEVLGGIAGAREAYELTVNNAY
ncbi:hypothetical protein HHL17_26575 [Chitinophaga sp. G-6-1-13]|uniref:Lipocalin-like domain-containing protein n=1 Tax=Chitinophaga fulva TaxID=2728842 RepID=A0A848GTH7_9BACT|nr:hypothetical protein [Chitinophaga fulva]NML40791.1 hypothetical protein [Chitinophaga fulva]